jgi:hypothetical protein
MEGLHMSEGGGELKTRKDLQEEIDRLLHERGRYRQALGSLELELKAIALRIRVMLDCTPLRLVLDSYPPEERADSDPPFRTFSLKEKR